MKKVLLSSAFAVSIASLSSTDALACTAPVCWPASVAPRAGFSIPANAPALPFSRLDAKPSVTIDGVPLVLTEAKDTGWGGYLAVPSAMMPVGEASLSYNESCVTASSTSTAWKFNVTPSRPLPAKAGSLHVKNVKVVDKYSVRTSSGSCSVSVRAVTFDLVLRNAPDVAAFAAIEGFSLALDGSDGPPFNTQDYGQGEVDADGDVIAFQSHATCGTRDPSDDNGLPLGDHRLDIQPRIAGSAEGIVPASLHVNIGCDAVTEVDDTTDGGADSGPPVSPETPGSDTNDASNRVANADSAGSDAGCGCSVPRREKRSSLLSLIGAAVAGVGVARRKRAVPFKTERRDGERTKHSRR